MAGVGQNFLLFYIFLKQLQVFQIHAIFATPISFKTWELNSGRAKSLISSSKQNRSVNAFQSTEVPPTDNPLFCIIQSQGSSSTLNLSHTMSGVCRMAVLAELLAREHGIERLLLRNNAISDVHLQILVECLSKSLASVTALDLSDNAITSKGAEILVPVVKVSFIPRAQPTCFHQFFRMLHIASESWFHKVIISILAILTLWQVLHSQCLSAIWNWGTVFGYVAHKFLPQPFERIQFRESVSATSLNNEHYTNLFRLLISQMLEMKMDENFAIPKKHPY